MNSCYRSTVEEISRLHNIGDSLKLDMEDFPDQNLAYTRMLVTHWVERAKSPYHFETVKSPHGFLRITRIA